MSFVPIVAVLVLHKHEGYMVLKLEVHNPADGLQLRRLENRRI